MLCLDGGFDRSSKISRPTDKLQIRIFHYINKSPPIVSADKSPPREREKDVGGVVGRNDGEELCGGRGGLR